MTVLDKRYEVFEKEIKPMNMMCIRYPEIYADAYALGFDFHKVDKLVWNPWARVELYILLIKEYQNFKSNVEEWTGDDAKETLKQLEELHEKYRTNLSRMLHAHLKNFCFEE